MSQKTKKGRTIAANELLMIDFDAALSKLAGSQLDGPWQLPAELVRWSIACGASQVDLDIGARNLTLSASGAIAPREVLSDAAALLDTQLDAADRHRALVDLETRDAFVLAALASLEPETARIESGTIGVELAASGELRINSQLRRPDLFAELTGVGFDAARAKRWLRRVARFSPIPITINGREIARGFEQVLEARARGEAVPPCAIGIPIQGEAPRLWLLRHGVISTRATIPGYPAFEAAIEMADVTDPSAPAAVLRETLTLYVDRILDAAVEVMIYAARRTSIIESRHRPRLARLLLLAASKRIRPAEIASLPIFTLQSADLVRLVSLDEIRRRVEVETGGICSLPAISPDQELARFAASGREVLVLTRGERALLGELLQVVFSSPPHRLRVHPLKRFRKVLTEALQALRIRLIEAHRKRLAIEELTDAEQAFLVGLDEIIPLPAPARHGFGSSDTAVRALPGGALLLGRQNPVVRACIAAVRSDPHWWFPVSAFLLRDRPSPGHLADAWRARPATRAWD